MGRYGMHIQKTLEKWHYLAQASGPNTPDCKISGLNMKRGSGFLAIVLKVNWQECPNLQTIQPCDCPRVGVQPPRVS